MNTRVESINGFEIRKYGCCGVFFFMVGEELTRKRLKYTLPNIEAAHDWIQEYTKANHSHSN